MHIAFIMDGNGRWAENKLLPRINGHEAGAKALLSVIDAIEKYDIEYTTFYAFSTDNQKRNNEEVGNILGIIAYFLNKYVLPIAVRRGYRIRFIGELSLLPSELLDVINSINKITINNKGRMFIFAIGYGGDMEIVNAVNTIIEKKNMLLDDTLVTIEEIRSNLYTVNIPDPDIVVRYGGYKRLSNFLPLQTIYSELMFFEKFWPDFEEEDIKKIIEDYKSIKRNFGGLNA